MRHCISPSQNLALTAVSYWATDIQLGKSVCFSELFRITSPFFFYLLFPKHAFLNSLCFPNILGFLSLCLKVLYLHVSASQLESDIHAVLNGIAFSLLHPVLLLQAALSFYTALLMWDVFFF